MASERNALAELAEELRVMSLDVVGDEETVLDKAYRIIAELSRVEVINDSNLVRDPSEAVTAVEMARAIAEEGVKV